MFGINNISSPERNYLNFIKCPSVFSIDFY